MPGLISGLLFGVIAGAFGAAILRWLTTEDGGVINNVVHKTVDDMDIPEEDKEQVRQYVKSVKSDITGVPIGREDK